MKQVLRYSVLFFLFTLFSCSSHSESDASATAADTSNAGPQGRLAKDFLSDCKKLYAQAKRMDSVLLNQNEVNVQSANEAIKAFTDFAYYCQSDSMSPVYLIKTAQVARVVNNIPQAKLALTHCIDTYLQFKERPAALFILAQLYDEKMYLNDENEARKLYEQIVNDYPGSDWALNAKAAIKFLGKSDEEIVKEFNKQQKQKKS